MVGFLKTINSFADKPSLLLEIVPVGERADCLKI
jgi:hypothetical protein